MINGSRDSAGFGRLHGDRASGIFTVDRLDFPTSAAVPIGSLLGRGVGKGSNRTFSKVAVLRYSRDAASDRALVLWGLSAQREKNELDHAGCF